MTTYKETSDISRSMNERRDCTVKALAITTGIKYERAHKVMKLMGRKDGRGLKSPDLNTQIRKMQMAVKLCDRIVGTAQFPERLTMNTVGERYPTGVWLVFTCNHVAALVNGHIEDWSEGRRNRVQWMIRVGV